MLLPPQCATHATLQVPTAEPVDLDLNVIADLADGVLDRLERRGYLTRGTAPATAVPCSSR